MDPDMESKMDILFTVMDNENDLTLTDGEGVIIRVSDSYEDHFFVTKDQVIGRSVYDLEREGVFKPSVTAAVLKAKRKATIMQQNKKGDFVLTTGVPIFGEDGEIEYVISFNSIDIADVYSIYDKYARLTELMREYSSEIRQMRVMELSQKEIVAQSKVMQDVLSLVAQVADTSANVMLTGETGVGKSLVAKTIHEYSGRAEGPFISINCAAIPANLLESELFGYEKGAFTGAGAKGKPGKIELASEGTLFLDEIGELSPDMQIKLLNVIQDKSLTRVGGLTSISVDFRLISATNQDLKQAIADKRFREDLFYRLNVVPIHIPPLRERPEDIVALTARFLSRFNREFGTAVSFSPEVYAAFEVQTWDGNIRQVENLVQRLVVTAKNNFITLGDLPRDMLDAVAAAGGAGAMGAWGGGAAGAAGVGAGRDTGLGGVAGNARMDANGGSGAAAGADVDRDTDADRDTGLGGVASNARMDADGDGGAEQTLRELVEQFEREVFLDAYRRYGTSVAVGKALGVSQPTAARRLRKYVPGYATDDGAPGGV